MANFIKKNNFITGLIFLISELICFFITRITIAQYDVHSIYSHAMNLVQGFYFGPIFLITISIFSCPKPSKSLLINTTIGLILYTIIFSLFTTSIISLFTNTPGIINFTKYASKIYFICLPLASFTIWELKKETTKNSYLFLIFKIFLLSFITLIASHFFGLTGVLYAWSVNELVCFIFFLKT